MTTRSKPASDTPGPVHWTPARNRALRHRIATVPFPNWIGMKLSRLGSGFADISLAIKPHHLQYQGLAHGGVLGALADTAATFALASTLPPGIDLITIEFKINFLAGVKPGTIVAKGRIIRSGRRIGVAQVDVFAARSKEPALTGTFTCLYFPSPKGVS